MVSSLLGQVGGGGDWRQQVDNRKAGNMVEELKDQLRTAKDNLAAKDADLEDVKRKYEVSKAAREELEVRLEAVTADQATARLDVCARVEEVRVRTSDVVRLDQEVAVKERRLEEALNSAIEAEKKIFEMEMSVKSLEGRVELLDNENFDLREEVVRKGGVLEERVLEVEEVGRRLVVVIGEAQHWEEEARVGREREEVLERRLEEGGERLREVRAQLDFLEGEGTKQQEVVVEEKDIEEKKGAFASMRAKFEGTRIVEKMEVKCNSCEELEVKVEKMEEELGRNKIEMEEVWEKSRRLEQRAGETRGEVEAVRDEKMGLQEERRRLEQEVTDKEVEVRRLATKTDSLEGKVEELEEQVRETREDLEKVKMLEEETSRSSKVVQKKLDSAEEKREKSEEEQKRLRNELGEVSDEVKMTGGKLKNAQEVLENCQDALAAANDTIEETKKKLEEVEILLKKEKMMNDDNEETISKLLEESKKAIEHLEKKEENREMLEKSLVVAELALVKMEEEVKEERRSWEEYRRAMEEQLQDIIDL